MPRVPEVTFPHRRSRRPFSTSSCRSTQREGSTMNWSNIESSWGDFKVNAKQQWGRLTDHELSDTLGRHEFLARKVQEAYALSKDETERQVPDWQSQQIVKQAPAQS